MMFKRKKDKEVEIERCVTCDLPKYHDIHVYREEGYAHDKYHEFNKPYPPKQGIFVSWVKHEGFTGEVISLYCPVCKTTNILLSEWAQKEDMPFWMYWKLELPCVCHLSDDPDKFGIMIGTFKNGVMGVPSQKVKLYPDHSIIVRDDPEGFIDGDRFGREQ